MRFCEADNCSVPVFGTCKVTRKGYCKRHQTLRQDFDRRTIIQKGIAKQKSLQNKFRNVQNEVDNKKLWEKKQLDLFYEERRKEMKGVCSEIGCNCTTNKNDDKYYRWSICHIVPKSLCPSVATNENNWIELCQDHHTQFDSTFDKAKKLKCFPEIKLKFQLIKQEIPANELRKVNPFLL